MGVLLTNLFGKEGKNQTLLFKTSLGKETYDDGQVKYKLITDEWNPNSSYSANTEAVLSVEELKVLKEIIDTELEISNSLGC